MDALMSVEALTVASTVSIVASVAPFLGLALMKREVPPAYWTIAAAFLMSVIVGDTVQRYDVAYGWSDGRWLNTYVWPPIAFALLTRAVLESVVVWWAVVGVLTAITWWMLGSIDGPGGAPATIVGSAVVLLAVFVGNEDLRPTLLVYCGLGSACYCMYEWTHQNWPVATGWWYGYQASRLLAFALFGRAAWKA